MISIHHATHRWLFLFFVIFASTHVRAIELPLFDGKTLAGWAGNTAVWRVEGGAITGGSMEGNPQNDFLATKKTYRNFILRLEYRIVGTDGFINGGVQFRSVRLTDPAYEMSGYQADVGPDRSGNLYDESRRKKALVQADKALIAEIEKPGDWNRYEIRCEGPHIRFLLNGRLVVDYVEDDSSIPLDGLIALQIHGANKAVASYRNISIEVLPNQMLLDFSVTSRFSDRAPQAAGITNWQEGRFSLGEDETVVFIGQDNLVRASRGGELESLLAVAEEGKKPRFRCMAWEGDTVYDQWRDVNFGDWKAQLDAVGATVIVAQFGQTEAFDGVGRLADFTAAYDRLLDQVAAGRRLVLLTPMSFEDPEAPLAPRLTSRNADVAAYADAVRKIASARNALCVDLTKIGGQDVGTARVTVNGLHLNENGQQKVAAEVLSQLKLTVLADHDRSKLLPAIMEKNRLFSECWRPANWAFVYGDRVSETFGKAGGNEPSLSETYELHKPMIAAWDSRIQALASGRPAPAAPAPKPMPSIEAVAPTPAEEQASFTVAEGWKVTLFASEIDGVAKPTQIAWDERGRLFVACSPTYPQTIPGVAPADFITMLEDTDGDGKADRTTCFAEGLTMVEGLEPGDGGLYVCDFDKLIHLRDRDGDGKADDRRVVFAGFGIGDTHQLINSISHGPDGSLWFTQGRHSSSRIETPRGLRKMFGGGIWRIRPRTQELEGFLGGNKAGSNCWGVAVDDFGQVFHKAGNQPGGDWSVPGLVALSDPDEYHPMGALFRSASKTTSLEFLASSALPAAVQGAAVTAGFFVNTIDLHYLHDDGAGFSSTEAPHLITSSCRSFRPVDVNIGPDGAIYIADWCTPVIGHYQASYADPMRDRRHGRIWRLAATGHHAVKPPVLAGLPPGQLLEQLQSPERWVRNQAKRLLGEGPSDRVLPATDAWIAALPKGPAGDRLRFEGLGVFEAHESPRSELLASLLAAEDPRLRAYAARTVGAWADRLEDPLEMLGRCVTDPHPRVRLEAIVSCSRVAKPQSVEVAVRALSFPRDRFIDYAMRQSVRALTPEWKPVLDRLTFGGDAQQADFVRMIANTVAAPPHPGKIVYESLCLACHQPDGNGLAEIYPPIASNELVNGDVQPLIRILTNGLMGPITVKGQTYGVVNPLPMPPMGLDDEQTADVLTYLRSNFGNEAPAVMIEQVKAERAKINGRTTAWTAKELGPRESGMPGGFNEIQNHDAQALAAAKYAVTAHDQKLKFEGIEKVEQQIVAGTNYRMTLKVSGKGKQCRAEAVVCRKLDGQHALTAWNWLDGAPTGPESK